MPALQALPHLFSSVERGLFPQRGGGFQTVGVSSDLIGTEDLNLLEEAAFYAVSRERRAAGALPVKETFFKLPSGRFAVGRTVDLGTDALGREGNYLSHHLVFGREELLEAGANPLAILDTVPLAEAETDLTPRELAPLTLDLTPEQTDPRIFEGINPALLANLATRTVDGGTETALLIGDETASRRLLRVLFAALAREERLRLTFSTHFYESHHLRSLFTLASVNSRSEAPPPRQQFTLCDLGDGEFPPAQPKSAYAAWLAERLKARDWEAVMALNGTLDRLRGNHPGLAQAPLPESAKACAALWERAGTRIVPELVGSPRLVKVFLQHVPAPSALADALLAAAPPSELCGPNAAPETVNDCLAKLKSAATGKHWSQWVKQWSDDPVLASISQKKSWWQKWKR